MSQSSIFTTPQKWRCGDVLCSRTSAGLMSPLLSSARSLFPFEDVSEVVCLAKPLFMCEQPLLCFEGSCKNVL